MNPILAMGIDWDATESVDESTFLEEPEEGVPFGDLPGYAMNAKNYKAPEKDFSNDLYREEREEIWSCPMLDTWGEIGEKEADFRVRISHEAKEGRDEAQDKVRDAAGKKVKTIESRIRTAEARLATEQAESSSAKMNAGIFVLGGLLKAIFGRKTGRSGFGRGSSVTKATAAYKQHQDVANAEAKIDGLDEELKSIRDAMERELAEIAKTFDPASLDLEKETLKPRRTDVQVERVALLWR